MASVTSQLIEEITAHAQSDCLEDEREICADGTYLPNNLRNCCCAVLFGAVICNFRSNFFSPLNAELNPTCPLLALFRAHHILHVSR